MRNYQPVFCIEIMSTGPQACRCRWEYLPAGHDTNLRIEVCVFWREVIFIIDFLQRHSDSDFPALIYQLLYEPFINALLDTTDIWVHPPSGQVKEIYRRHDSFYSIGVSAHRNSEHTIRICGIYPKTHWMREAVF
jgi:hypothetical protein